MTQIGDLSIVLAEPDSYKDIVELYISCLKQNWKDCPYPIYWANQSEKLDDEDVHVLNVGGDPQYLCGRLLATINCVKTKYILFSVADMILTKPVKTKEINVILNYLDKVGGKYCLLKRSTRLRMKADPIHTHFYHINANKPYNVGLTFGIFESDYLRNLIKDPRWTGWQFEEYCLQLAHQAKNDKSYYYDKNIGDVVHLISKGKFIPSAKRKIKRCGIDVSSLHRETLSWYESIIESGKRLITKICPIKLREPLKRIISKTGFKFSSKY